MTQMLAVLFLCSAVAWAAAAPEYNVNVHVNASRMVIHGNSSAHYQNVDVIIDGKKCQLESIEATNTPSCPATIRPESTKTIAAAATMTFGGSTSSSFPTKRSGTS